MPTDSFTGKPIPKGHGMMYVKKDGTVYWFGNKKSEKNFLRFHRTPSETKWTDFYHREKQIKLKSKSGARPLKNAGPGGHKGGHGSGTGMAAAEKK